MPLEIFISRARLYLSADVHRAVFGERAQKAVSLSAMKQRVKKYLKSKHARR